MESRKVTLKSIARELGVSLGTVHRAIYNKEGVSEETRKNILKYVEEKNYKINMAASALKRGTIRIAAVFPKPEGNDRYFFQDVWRGLEKAVEDARNFNLEIVKIPFSGDYTQQIKVMEDFYRRHVGEINGLITHIWNDDELNPIINQYAQAGVPVVLVATDAPSSRRLCCVSLRTDYTGKMAGELISDFIQPGGRVLIMGGKRDSSTHQMSAKGFVKMIQESSPDTEIIELYDYNAYYESDRMKNTLEEYLEKLDIRGVYSNNARGTVSIAKVVEKLGKAGQVKIVGSDINDASIDYLKRGVIQALIYQDPYRLTQMACQALFDNVIQGLIPTRRLYIAPTIVIKNNLNFYLSE